MLAIRILMKSSGTGLLATFIVASLSLSGCATPHRAPVSYPHKVEDFGQVERFPLECGAYRRGQVIEYVPDFRNYSIAYGRYDREVQNAVTLYWYPRSGDPESQARGEESTVLDAHIGARTTARRSFKVDQGGQHYDATLAEFEFDGLFAGSPQFLKSLMVVVFLPQGSFKIRSTVPIDQADAGRAAIGEMLRCVKINDGSVR